VKVKLFKLVQSVDQLSVLSSTKFQASMTLKIMRIMRAVRPELEDYDKKKNDLIKKFGVTLDNGDVKVSPDRMNDFFTELNPVLEQEVELPIEPIKLSELTLELTPIDLERLEWMLSLDE
jgi:hypothetical protein